MQAGDFDEIYPVRMSAAGGLSDLLEDTYKATKTRDRPGELPAAFRMLKATRVEDANMWARYAARRDEIQELVAGRIANGEEQICESTNFE